MGNSKIQPKYLTGLIIILAGGLLLLRNLDFIDFTIPSVIFSWQAILIIVGALLFINSQNKSVGLVLMIVGVLGIIPEYWPIVLILLGLFIIFRKNGFSFANKAGVSNLDDDSVNEKINEISFFGGGDRNFHINNLKGGSISAIFGGSSINLNDCTLAEGENIIDLFFVFGGSSFIIPGNWKVQVQTTSIFGGFSDKRIIPTADQITNDRVLIFKGLILFGGGEIKNIK
ncbi:MAG: DUF5668 domain-containing protein [Bacteroidota bacterium]